GVNAELLLLHGAQIAAADFITVLRQFQRVLAVGQNLAQRLFAAAQRPLAGQRALDVVDRPQREPRVVGNGFLLFERADPDLRVQRAALIDRRDQFGAGAAGG